MRSMQLFRLAACVLAAIWASGCRAPEAGWQRLWQSEWTWHNHGLQWVCGVTAVDRRFDCPGNGLLLRTELLNTTAAPTSVRVTDADRSVDWELAGGEVRTVEVSLSRGEVRIDAPPGIALGSPRLGRPLAAPKLLVLVLVDTLRADHVSPELMPGVIDAFADGRRWRDVTANSSWTIPSVASLFSSRPVLELTSPAGEIIGLPDDTPTLATRLHDAGYETGAVVANYTIHVLNGFAAGFSSYQVPDGHGTAKPPDGEWVVDGARRFLAAHRGENALLYLHLMDPHEPYRRHGGTGPAPPPLKPLARRQRRVTEDEARLLRELYAGEVRHVDSVLAPFLAELPNSAVVALVADHGEGLGEHDAWAHGLNLFQEAVAVPVMMRAPGLTAGDVDEPSQLLDVGPTLLELCGQVPDPDQEGRSLLAGGSPPPLIAVTFSAGPLRWAWRQGSRKVVVRTRAQAGISAAARTVLEEARPLPAGAYSVDLAADPAEDRPGPIPAELVPEIATAFAETAGRLVPGLQLVVRDDGSATTLALEVDGELDVVQAWGTSDVTFEQRGGRFALTCASASPLCMVSLAASTVPETVTPVASDLPWANVVAGQPVDPRSLEPPRELGQGAYLWWVPERPMVVGGHDETLERLRALGYID